MTTHSTSSPALLWCLQGVGENNKSLNKREKRQREGGEMRRTVRNKALLRFPLWAGFPRRVNQLRATTELFITSPRSLLEWVRGGGCGGGGRRPTGPSLCFPVNHTAVVTPLGTGCTTTTHPGCRRINCLPVWWHVVCGRMTHSSLCTVYMMLTRPILQRWHMFSAPGTWTWYMSFSAVEYLHVGCGCCWCWCCVWLHLWKRPTSQFYSNFDSIIYTNFFLSVL